jgi:hypothetical protein
VTPDVVHGGRVRAYGRAIGVVSAVGVGGDPVMHGTPRFLEARVTS